MNRLCSHKGIAALAFLFALASAWAQTDLAKRVSIDVNSVAPQEVFGSLARSMDCEASVDPAVQQPVTLRVVDVSGQTFQEALKRIMEVAGAGNVVAIGVADGSKPQIKLRVRAAKKKIVAR
jgi:hypothetical protein